MIYKLNQKKGNIMTNLIGDTLSAIVTFVGSINVYMSHRIHSIIKIEDPYIVIGLSTAIVVVPLMWFLITRFTESFDYKKALIFPMFVSVVSTPRNRENLPFTEYLDTAASVSGMIGFVLAVIVSVMLIMQDPYYQGLFGRFRDD